MPLCFDVLVFITPYLLEFLSTCLFHEDSLHPVVFLFLLKKLSLFEKLNKKIHVTCLCNNENDLQGYQPDINSTLKVLTCY